MAMYHVSRKGAIVTIKQDSEPFAAYLHIHEDDVQQVIDRLTWSQARPVETRPVADIPSEADGPMPLERHISNILLRLHAIENLPSMQEALKEADLAEIGRASCRERV